MNLKHTVLSLAKYSGLFALARKLTARKIRILAYHGIWLGEGHFGNFLFMAADTFRERMALLARLGYPVVPLSKAVGSSADDLPDNATVITIDDGWQGTYTTMLPVLEAQGFPATVYLTTYYCLAQRPVIDVAFQYLFHALQPQHCPELQLPGRRLPVITPEHRSQALKETLRYARSLNTDSDRQALLENLYEQAQLNLQRILDEKWFHLMDARAVSDAARRGINFELHTHRHRVDVDGHPCLDDEIHTNRQHIHALTGQQPQHFCYPSGRFTPALWPMLERCEVLSATTTDIGLVDSTAERFALPRLLDGEAVSTLEFEAEMSGFMALLRAGRARLAAPRPAKPSPSSSH